MNEIVVIKRNIVRSSPKKKSLPDLEFDRIAWAIKGRSVDNYRKILQNIHIANGRIASTDGHILLVAKFEEGKYPDGVYNVLLSSWKLIVLEKMGDVEFPKWESIIPTEKPEFTRKMLGSLKYSFSDLLRSVYRRKWFDISLLQRSFIPCDSLMAEIFPSEFSPLVLKEVDNEGNWVRLSLTMPMKETEEEKGEV